jgi:hypothetical protein
VQAPAGPPPQVVALQLMTGFWVTQAMNIVCRLGVPDALAAGPRTAEELAPQVHAHAASLYRIMRSLASVGVFTIDGQRRFGLTPVGETLRSDVPGSMRHFASFIGEPGHWQAWGSMLGAVQSGQDAFTVVHGQGFFQYAQAHPQFDKVFNAAMTSFSAMDGHAILASYDFSGVRTLVDVGGGQGLLLATLLQAHAHTQGILFDQPHVVEQAVPALDSRCQRVGGDFFQSVPAGGDVYILKTIIHDWPDEACVKILKNCAAALPAGGRVLVVDQVVPPDNSPSFARFLDLEMMVMTQGGRERTEAEFADLFAQSGLRLQRVIPTPGPHCILEAVRD